MTTDVRTLLHDAADAPTRGPDIGGALQRARDRRRRRRGVGALVAVVVIALVTGAVALGGGGGDDARVAIGPRQGVSEIPDGWKTVHADPGITVSVPATWKVPGQRDTDRSAGPLARRPPPGSRRSARRMHAGSNADRGTRGGRLADQHVGVPGVVD